MLRAQAKLFSQTRQILTLAPALTLGLVGLLMCGTAQTATPSAHRPSLEELAATSELIGVAQVYYTDYKVSHGYPVSGFAHLRMLITYRSDHDVDTLRVPEKGLHSGECYFPITEYTEDGPRFLVFLSRNDEGDYIGNPRLCKLPVGVTADHGYAIPFPRPELRLDEAAEAAIKAIEFNDANVTVDASDMTRPRAEIRAKELGGELRDQRIIFTQGMPVIEARKLMGEENLRPNRLRR